MPAHVYANHLLWSDNYASYANQAAFEAAYPYDPPVNNSYSGTPMIPNLQGVAWGLTNGPDGQPGVAAQYTAITPPHTPTPAFDKFPLNPQGRTFRFQGRFYTLGSTTGMRADWAPSGHRDDDFAEAGPSFVVNASGQLQISVRTTVPYQTVGFPPRWVATTAGSFPSLHTIRVDWHLSTLTATSPGVWAPDPDGWVEFWDNGTMVASFDGPVWNGRSDLNPTPYWNELNIHAWQKFSLAEVWDETTTTPPTPTSGTDDSVPCCGSTVDPGTGETTPGDTLGPDTSVIFIPPTMQCDGGGTVPLIADPTDSEAWT